MTTKISLQKQAPVLAGLVKIIDILIYLFFGIASFVFVFHSFKIPFLYQIAIMGGSFLVWPIFRLANVYQPLRGKSLISYLNPLLVGALLTALILMGSAFLTKHGESYSRLWFLIWQLATFLSLIIFRIVLAKILRFYRSLGRNQKRIIIIGAGKLTHELIIQIKNNLWSGFKIVAIFDHAPSAQNKIENLTIANPPEDIEKFIEAQHIQEVWLVASPWDYGMINTMVNRLKSTYVTLRYFPEILGIDLLHQSISDILGFPVVNVISSPMFGVNQLLKNIEDKILAILFLLLLSPLFLLFTILVKISSPGPVFYRQERISWNGKKFWMLKFRTMPVNAEEKTGAVWAVKNDQRVTRIGSFLRKTSLDEIPQFWNVLKGDMSIVGPRPERPVFVKQFKNQIPAYTQKHLVKAGITGWAQVNGWRGNTNLEKRIEFDLYYINHWSLWFDLKIIFLTVFKGLINRNAY
jgi:putative colanic acid biosysnthesis UDP-glucose lipid carrier transferase